MSDLAKSMGDRGKNNSSKITLGNIPVGNAANSSAAHAHRSVSRIARPRIGQLLLEAGVVKPQSLHEALHLARESKQQVGRVLIGLGYANERDISAALFVQTLISEGAVTERAAIRAVRLAAARKIDVAEILKGMADDTTVGPDDGGLGSLLVASGVVNPLILEEAILKSQHAGLLLGRTLLVMQAITTRMLDAALTVLVMQRDQQITKDNTLRILREMNRSSCTLEGAIKLLRIEVQLPGHTRLGEILALSKLISESDSTIAVERALLERRMLGDILVRSGAIDNSLLDDALTMQTMVTRSAITATQAGTILQRAHTQKKSISEAAIELNIFQDELTRGAQVVDLLKQGNIISNHDVNTAMLEYEQYQMPACQALLASGRLSPATYDAALECIELCDRGQIKPGQGVIALDICERSRCDLKTALANMGLSVYDTPEPEPTSEPAPNDSLGEMSAKCNATVSEWNSFSEFRLVIALFAVALTIDTFSFFVLHEDPNMQMGIYYASVLLVGIGLMKLGQSWKRSEEQRKIDHQQHVDSAREMKSRLEKRR